jgi:glycosyltransferase involved in cell wall biosynthesis
MKLAYLGVTNDGTGYASMGIDTILALDAVNIDTVVRPIRLATQYVQAPQRVLELEGKSPDNITHVVQHILPPYFSYRRGFKNIGFAHFETTHFLPSNWQYYCNLLDELWVSCDANIEAAQKSGVTIPIKKIPKAVNKNLFCREKYQNVDFGQGNRYVFYHIGDYSTRKNTVNLIKAYFEEFSKQDHVVLILKTYVEGVSQQESIRIIQEDIAKIKQSLRRFGMDMYPPVILITDYLSTEQIMALHSIGDCFVSLERGSAWTIPAQDAIAMGNYCILNGWGGHTEYVTGNYGWLLEYKMVPVHGMIRCPYPNLYTCHEYWAEPDYEEFKYVMRQAYNGKYSISEQSRLAFIEKFSYQNVGEQIRKIL